MAKITRMPSAAVIDGFKGNIDFYYWMGIPVARSWPRSPGHDRAPEVQNKWPKFIYVAQLWASLDANTKDAWNYMATGTVLTGRDMFHRSYYHAQVLLGAFD